MNLDVLFLKGSPVYTPLRQQKILQHLQRKYPEVCVIEAIYVYFVACKKPLSSKKQSQLESLLPNARLSDYPILSEKFSFWVLPRLGTISPWSVKTTEIARNCGLSLARIERGIFYQLFGISNKNKKNSQIVTELYDPLTESILFSLDNLTHIFQYPTLLSFSYVNLLEKGKIALLQANQLLGLTLTDKDLQYLLTAFHQLNRNPTDVELMMFAQINSEHCRHRIFNAKWRIDGTLKDETLFTMIRYTYQMHPKQILVAYHDNAAIIKGSIGFTLTINSVSRYYKYKRAYLHKVLKVETHNYPTAMSPFSGAATGSGGEIRDAIATGRGGQSQAGLTGFSVSHLHIPGFSQPWEKDFKHPRALASPLEIILQGPIGAASFNNEFGRPNICGYFRTLEYKGNLFIENDTKEETIAYGYHKPIMISGGIGQIYSSQVSKQSFEKNTLLIVIGGPSMTVGLGGGSASSRGEGAEADNITTKVLDLSSVQRSNPEMQRRAQELINGCIELGKANPILSIHDVGSGGLSNAFPELIAASECGGEFELRDIPNDAPGMTPLEIWCNEAQERFVLAITVEKLEVFRSIAERERCPFAIVGYAKQQKKLVVHDNHFHSYPVNVPLSLLFDDVPSIQREDRRRSFKLFPFNVNNINLTDAVKRVLQYPAVADKSFLITISDRSVGGKVVRDQMIGPWQVPVADLAVIADSFFGYQGQALSIGERAPIAMISSVASARMAVGEAITNIAAAPINKISQVVLSANWMMAENFPGEGVNLYEAVRAVAKELCPTLGICIPVGKDSLSMYTSWREGNQKHRVISPLSLIITATAPVLDVRYTLTPQLQIDIEKTQLLFIDLGKGTHLLGGSCLTQVYDELGDKSPDVDDPHLLRNFFLAIQILNRRKLLLAYHDRSDGGLLATLCEMSFAAHTGITVEICSLGNNPIASIFTEALGSVIQIKKEHIIDVLAILKTYGLKKHTHIVGEINRTDTFVITYKGKVIFQEARVTLQQWWSETSYRLQALRDNPICAKQQYDKLLDDDHPERIVLSTFDNQSFSSPPCINVGERPLVAILREQGSNGHREMAAAFCFAGFDSVDVHMSDLLKNDYIINLRKFNGIVACGGFSFGDVLGAGRGWAQSILMQPRISDEFSLFFQSKDRFALGVCNGCQLFSHLKSIIPGAGDWPVFERNTSEQFEARLSLVEIPESPSLFFREMSGSRLPIVVSHGEGRAVFEEGKEQKVKENKLIVLQYINSYGLPTMRYPENPNGSPIGITGLTTPDGRITILMPHPERVFRTIQLSWHPKNWGEISPWMRMFYNARTWVD
ncbi:phosphoribosylformylglycinamidine synthase [Coxiella-like endosymbiont of Amblyomma americanum]|nr:phosphoribosylformylglycinamidine synthase [Coxiella-like endosymbiont of Amblyomma americanum]